MTTTTTLTGANATAFEFDAVVTVNYMPFKSTICQFNNKKITRERLIFDWKEAQQEQGIRVVRRKACGEI